MSQPFQDFLWCFFSGFWLIARPMRLSRNQGPTHPSDSWVRSNQRSGHGNKYLGHLLTPHLWNLGTGIHQIKSYSSVKWYLCRSVPWPYSISIHILRPHLQGCPPKNPEERGNPLNFHISVAGFWGTEVLPVSPHLPRRLWRSTNHAVGFLTDSRVKSGQRSG